MRQQHFAGRTKPLTVAGPRDLRARVAAAEQALYPDLFGKRPLAFEVRFATLDASPTALGGASVTALPVRHVAESDPHGLRVRVADRLVAYSNAVWSDELARVAKGADLCICEATNDEHDDASHLSYRTLMAHRDELDCERIVLTHLGTETIAHARELAVEHAVDGTAIEL